MIRRRKRKKRILIVAGPNGAGKTTFIEKFLKSDKEFDRFINADKIARGLSPEAPGKSDFEAAQIMLRELEAAVSRGENFIVETTLAGHSYARKIPRWQKAGYHVKLVFLTLPSADAAVARVKMRVQQRGHDIPEAVIRRRFDRGLRNFESTYRHLADSWSVYDNVGSLPRLERTSDEG